MTLLPSPDSPYFSAALYSEISLQSSLCSLIPSPLLLFPLELQLLPTALPTKVTPHSQLYPQSSSRSITVTASSLNSSGPSSPVSFADWLLIVGASQGSSMDRSSISLLSGIAVSFLGKSLAGIWSSLRPNPQVYICLCSVFLLLCVFTEPSHEALGLPN